MDGQGKRVKIYISNTDQWHHRQLFIAILELLRREGCAGATVEQGVAGLGGSRRIKMVGLVDVILDVPVIITWIDRPDRVARVLPRVAEMVTAGLITVEDVQIYQYTPALREGLPNICVEEVMTRMVTTVHPDAPLAEVVEKLIDKDYTALPVVDEGGRVVGIISDTDLLERGEMGVSLSLEKAASPDLARALIHHLRQSPRTVADVMTSEPVTIGPQAQLSEAARLMSRHRLKRLPVVDEHKRVIGVLGRLDILTALAAGYLPQIASRQQIPAHPAGPQTVAEVMDPNVPTVLPEAPLTAVLALLAGTPLKRVVIVDADRHVVGMISDSDLFLRLSHEYHASLLEYFASRLPLGTWSAGARDHWHKARGKTAADLMTREVVTLAADSPIGPALALSAEKHIKRFPVVDADGKLVGIVGRMQLLSALVGETTGEGTG